jgi:phosphatidylserine/phosphatidylglycerophosphate/cardiolipin synthase-like enzyme
MKVKWEAKQEVKQLIQEVTTKAPTDQEVCFSPDENCDIKLVKFIQTAKKSLDIAIFDLTHDKIAHTILVASKKIPVRVVADRRQAKTQHSLVKLLIKGGVPVRFGRQRGIMHDKFTLIDGTRLETGSFNYTSGATSKNNENQIYLSQTEIIERYKKRFEKIWNESTPPRSGLQ